MSSVNYHESDILPKVLKNFPQVNSLLQEITDAFTVIGKHNRTLGKEWTDAKTVSDRQNAIRNVIDDLGAKSTVKKNLQTGHPGVKDFTTIISIYKPYKVSEKTGKGTGGEIARNFRGICNAKKDITLKDLKKRKNLEDPITVTPPLAAFMGLNNLSITSRANITRFLNNYFATMDLKGKYPGSSIDGDGKRKNFIKLNNELKTLFRHLDGTDYKNDQGIVTYTFNIESGNTDTFVPSVRFNSLIKGFINKNKGKSISSDSTDKYLYNETCKLKSIREHIIYVKNLTTKLNHLNDTVNSKELVIINKNDLLDEINSITNQLQQAKSKLADICTQYNFPYGNSLSSNKRNSGKGSAAVNNKLQTSAQTRSQSKSPSRSPSRSPSASPRKSPRSETVVTPPVTVRRGRNITAAH